MNLLVKAMHWSLLTSVVAAITSTGNIGFENPQGGDLLLADGTLSPIVLVDENDSISILRAAADLSLSTSGALLVLTEPQSTSIT